MVGGDEALAKRLEKYSSPDQVGKALLSLQNRLSSGELKMPKPRPVAGADGKVDPEAVKAWKAEQGLVAEPDGYNFPLGNGVKLEDLDEGGKGRIAKLNGAFFDADLSQTQVDKVVGTYNEMVEESARAQAAMDAKSFDTCEDDLRANWGADYRDNINANLAFMEKTFGDDMTDAMMGARLGDGSRLMANPAFAKALNGLARAANPYGAAETGETSGGKSVAGRIEEIKQIMKTDIGRYQNEGLDKEYQKLLERLDARGQLDRHTRD